MMKAQFFKSGDQIAMVAVVWVFLLFGGFYAFWVRPWDSGVVASLETPDGSRYMVTQTYNSWSEPYTVSFYSQTPGGEWRWSYLDHESGSWRDTILSYDPASERVTLTEKGIERYVVDRKKKPVIGSPAVPPFDFPES